MTNDHWITLDAAFAKATSLKGAERDEMLADFARENPNLEQQLLELLAADARGDQKIANPIARSARNLAEQSVDHWEGRTVGAWTVTQRIADGGMGSVFLAERSDDEYQQVAALKVMAGQLLAKDAVARFRSERQILASLNHSNIAKLIDGGTTDDNLPFLVLEYVDGLPIDRYCDENRLAIPDRLRLFRRVCAAVDYAHRNLIVHRDLKPSNILVDPNGDPKLLDFGIAKLLEAGSEHATVTRQGVLLLTPEYASPEQVRGESPTVVTDVYALGVLLYRILTGRSPYGSDLTSRQQIEHAIVETEPKRPSTVVSGGNDTSGRSASAQQLQKRLTGDLDNIVLKALQKDPDRRYASAALFADDVDRYLAHRPVSARADSIGYRMRKFVRRNRLAVTSAGVFLLSIAALSSFYAVRITQERDLAQQERATAEEVTNFLVDIFAATEAGQPDAEIVTVREVLDRGAERIDESLVDQPLVRARMHQHIARTYASIARYDDANQNYLAALTVFEQETGDSADTAHALYRYANSFLSLRDWQSAHDNYEKSLQMHRSQPDPDQKEIAQVLRLMSYTAQSLGNKDEAGGYLDEMMPIIESVYGPKDPQYANALYSRATLLREFGKNEEAIVLSRDALQIIIDARGEESPSTVNYRHLVGLIEWDRGNFEVALAQYERGIATRSAVLGPDHPSLFNLLFSYGATLAKLERYEDAATSHQRLLALQRESLGEDNFAVAYTEGGYGMVLVELGRIDEAEAAFLNANRIWETNYGPGYLESGVATIGLGHVARARGEVDQARRFYQQGVAVREQGRGRDHPATARAVASLADFEVEVGNLEVASAYYQRALSIFEDPAHPDEHQAETLRQKLQAIDAQLAP
ncbi:MAG: serine/threonine-protein kinase [Pseudomonadota bacterium]